MTGHGDIHVAEGLIGHTHILSYCMGHHFLVGQLLGFLVLSFKDEAAHFRQRGLGIGVYDVIGLSCPDGFFIQLDVFHGRCVENHATHHTVADGQRLCPCHGRTVIPEAILGCDRGADSREEDSAGNEDALYR